MAAGRRTSPPSFLRSLRGPAPRAALHEGWVIANHILVSFHVAFISSVLALPLGEVAKGEVLQFIFVSWETLVSALFVLVTFHTGIAWHELGHFLAAARLNALNDAVLERVGPRLRQRGPARWLYLAGLFLRIPYGKADGVKREGLNYYPDAPYNLAVAAAGPRASRNLAALFLPPAALLLASGLLLPSMAALYAGRLCLGLGLVGLLDFLLADPGKYREFQQRERRARDKAARVEKTTGWSARAAEAKERMLSSRMQRVIHPDLGPVTAPWQFRNCGMGGRHTEKEYPESNISMQEAMFLILEARDYQEAQEITIRLQTRLKEIIENEEGCRVMGIGLEGGLAPYIEKADYPVPELRLWAMLKRAIEECGLRPGTDVAIALDPALSELEKAFRDEFNQPDAVGMYLFWRDKAKTVLDRDAVLELYVQAIEHYEIPILSIEDAFSEHDFEGWKKILERLGARIFVIGDDLVTTNDATIEQAADHGLSNAALIKANQIGTLSETLLAMLVALGKGQELVVSHRSKSPNDDMEAQIALAANALGLKCGGGANTERLVKYQAVTELMMRAGDAGHRAPALAAAAHFPIRRLRAWEEPTNAGIPTVGAQAEIALPGVGAVLRFRGATPLGTSAGEGEAIHLVDGVIEYAEHHEALNRHPALFREVEPGVHAFRGQVEEGVVAAAADPALAVLFARAQRYGGKGCLTAVDNVREVIAPFFEGKDAAELTLSGIDRALLDLELRVARRRGKLGAEAAGEERVRVMQRKQNLGMNAVLSVSLALARAAAHVRGKELYELLREEMMAIVERLAAAHGVAVGGTAFDDYVQALREVTARLAAAGRSLHGELRRITAIYEPAAETGPAVPAPLHEEPPAVSPERLLEEVGELLGAEFRSEAGAAARAQRAATLAAAALAAARREGRAGELDWRALGAAAWLVEPASGDDASAGAKLARAILSGQFAGATLDRVEAILHACAGGTPAAPASREARLLAAALAELPASAPAPSPAVPRAAAPAPASAALLPPGFHAAETAAVTELLVLFERAWCGGDEAARREATRRYLELKGRLACRNRPFGVVNNRFFHSEGLLVPWIAGRHILLHHVLDGAVRCVDTREHLPGEILTDAALLARGAFRGEAADLEQAIFLFDPARADLRPIQRLRDIVALLQRVNATTNRSEANLLLRHLAARLCAAPGQDFLRAKNLQPEVNNLVAELGRFLNGSLSPRLSFLARVLVRNLSGLVGQPKLIDRIWNATIDLAEIHVRGSAIVNELRRSSHHSLGRRTLRLARAYRDYLASGDASKLAGLDLPELAPADQQALESPAVRAILVEVVEDLERLLGQAEVIERLRAWQEGFAAALLRCPFGHSLAEEVETLVAEGVHGRNRWSWFHHLRLLGQKAAEFATGGGPGAAFGEVVERLRGGNPENAGFDPAQAEQELRRAAESFAAGLRAAHQDELFAHLDQALGLYQAGDWFEAFRSVGELRGRLLERRRARGPEELGYHLALLDCLLEEMAYLSLRHLAAGYAEAGVDLPQCFEIIRLAARNLAFDGLQSQELADLAELLVTPGRSGMELQNLLAGLGRSYHMVLRRVTMPFEVMRERLGLSEAELRGALANMQRYMHDLSTMVNFADLAATRLRGREHEMPAAGAASAAVAVAVAAADAPVLHLSHRDEIKRMVEQPARGECLRNLYGGKGSSLLYISYLNVPTRDGFVLPTALGRQRAAAGAGDGLDELLERHLGELEDDLERRDGRRRRVGDPGAPLLLAVRGGSVFSMPGILDTVLFLGMNGAIAEAMAADDPWHAWDSYRRFLASFAHARWHLDLEVLDLIEAAKQRHDVRFKEDLPAAAMRGVAEQMVAAIRAAGHGAELDRLLAEPRRQLRAAVEAVLASWDIDTARRYRQLKRICDSWHTAVVVQEMAFGNHSNEPVGPGMDESCASLTGVVSRTRVDANGLRQFVGDIKFSAAGEDLVGGVTRSFLPIAELRESMPRLEARLRHIVAKIRRFMGTDQEVEFTVERGVLSVLQARTASVGIGQVQRELKTPGTPLTRGIGVCGGGFRGLIGFSEADLRELAPLAAAREDVDGVLLVLENPTPEDIPLILSAQGLLTRKGGSTAHAAVAVNGIEDRSYSAVMSAVGLELRPREQRAWIAGAGGAAPFELRKGEVLTIHGGTGEVFAGARELMPSG